MLLAIQASYVQLLPQAGAVVGGEPVVRRLAVEVWQEAVHVCAHTVAFAEEAHVISVQ